MNADFTDLADAISVGEKMRKRAVLVVVCFLVLNVLACDLLGGSRPEAEPTAGSVASPTSAPAEATETPEGIAPPADASPTPREAWGATPKPPPQAPAAPTALNVPLTVHNSMDVARVNEGITSGLPLPRDLEVTDSSQLRLVDVGGQPVPAQFAPLARWGGAADDASKAIRWVLIDFQANVGPLDTAYYFLQEGGPSPALARPLRVSEEAEALIVDTGATAFRISKVDGGLTAPGLVAPPCSALRQRRS